MLKNSKSIFFSVIVIIFICISTLLLFHHKKDIKITNEISISDKNYIKENIEEKEFYPNDLFTNIKKDNIEQKKNDEEINNYEISDPIEKNEQVMDSLIIETKNEEVLKKYDNIISEVKKLQDNLYVVNFENTESKYNEYVDLKNDVEITNIIKDYKIYTFDYNQNAWGVETTGLNTYSSMINFNKSSKNIKVAVLDTGINKNHEVFSKNNKINFDKAYNYIDKSYNVNDDFGHGTAVAGVIAESTSENIQIVPVKIMNNKGEGNLSTLLQAVKDIYKYVDIINLSVGSKENISESEKNAIEKLFKEVYDYGTIIVCAARK